MIMAPRSPERWLLVYENFVSKYSGKGIWLPKEPELPLEVDDKQGPLRLTSPQDCEPDLIQAIAIEVKKRNDAAAREEHWYPIPCLSSILSPSIDFR